MLTALLFSIAVLWPPTTSPIGTAAIPEGWHVRADKADASTADVRFDEMPPGWHVTTGPAIILYAPSRTASGTYTLRSESFLFDPGTRREGYGVLIGGANLDGDGQRYTYFLIRRSGDFLIKRRAGETLTTVRDWTPHPAILQYDARGEAQTAKNVLGIDVGATEVAFLVNGTVVTTVPRSAVDTEGMVGLRVNHELNVHVSSLEITPAR